MAYSARIPSPLHPKDHEPIRTLAEARAYMLALPPAVAAQSAWQAAAGRLIEAAETGDPVKVAAFARQIERALFVSYRLDLSGETGSGAAKARRISSRSTGSRPAATKSS